MPKPQLLSNGTYHVRVMAWGHGASCREGAAVTRWCEDATRDSSGTCCHVHQFAASGGGSSGTQPTLTPAGTSGYDLREGRAIIWWRDEDIDTRSEPAVLCSLSAKGAPRLFDKVRQQIDLEPGTGCAGKPGRIFALDDRTLDDGDRSLLQRAATIVVTDAATLTTPLAHHPIAAGPAASDGPLRTPIPKRAEYVPPGDLFAFNGFGGFTPDGREYVITTRRGA